MGRAKSASTNEARVGDDAYSCWQMMLRQNIRRFEQVITFGVLSQRPVVTRLEKPSPRRGFLLRPVPEPELAQLTNASSSRQPRWLEPPPEGSQGCHGQVIAAQARRAAPA